MGRRPRVSDSSLPSDAATDVAFRCEQTLGRIRQLQNFGAKSIQRRRATYDRFILTTFLCTLQRLISATGLIQSLQHSIPGAWLTLTQAGVTPASQSDLASPHVHRFVLPFFLQLTDIASHVFVRIIFENLKG